MLYDVMGDHVLLYDEFGTIKGNKFNSNRLVRSHN